MQPSNVHFLYLSLGSCLHSADNDDLRRLLYAKSRRSTDVRLFPSPHQCSIASRGSSNLNQPIRIQVSVSSPVPCTSARPRLLKPLPYRIVSHRAPCAYLTVHVNPPYKPPCHFYPLPIAQSLSNPDFSAVTPSPVMHTPPSPASSDCPVRLIVPECVTTASGCPTRFSYYMPDDPPAGNFRRSPSIIFTRPIAIHYILVPPPGSVYC
ncbi:hypothetical protein LXA43DRAFT_524967 [Ganoderma leucocontextum]|nr:hypothetical protein LXA43DRAFT_524967 [Ganoderma leucocontextum]